MGKLRSVKLLDARNSLGQVRPSNLCNAFAGWYEFVDDKLWSVSCRQNSLGQFECKDPSLLVDSSASGEPGVASVLDVKAGW